MYALEKQSKFSRKSTHVARRAWNILRLALLWARKGGVLKNKHKLAIISFSSKLTRKLIHRHSIDPRSGALAYGDHEFSFDETPIYRVKMRRRSDSLRFKLPCINPHVADYSDYCGGGGGGEDFMIGRDEDEMCGGGGNEIGDFDGDDEGIDLRAEEFIANFYEEMKLQRQISSYLRSVRRLWNVTRKTMGSASQ